MKALVLCMLLLTGCGATLQPKVEIPAALTQKCQPLERLAGTDGKSLLKNIVDNAELYHKCSDMHDKLIEAVSPNGMSEPKK
jgi:hypothetical protein